jgi:hypothetical protein
MSSPTVYVLDANGFIEPAKGYYAFDLVPAYWDELAAHGAAGRVCTVDRVAAEVLSPAEVNTWINGAFKAFIHDTNVPDVVTQYAALMNWAQAQPFLPAAKSEFAMVADAWLIAYAAAKGATVVTHEKFDANCRRRVKIPNACQSLGVPTIGPFEMMRALGMKLTK